MSLYGQFYESAWEVWLAGVPSPQGLHSFVSNFILPITVLHHSWEEVGCDSDIIVPIDKKWQD